MASLLRQFLRQRVISSLQTTYSKSILSKHVIASNVRAPTQPLARFFQSSPILRQDTTETPAHHLPRDIYRYEETIQRMTNDELNDPSTIPGFSNLIHSPPRDRTATPAKALVGNFVSDKMTKTVNVKVDRYKIIPKYRKRVKHTKKFMAHDEEEVCKEGYLVMIVPCQRLSRKKHFRVHDIIRQKGNML